MGSVAVVGGGITGLSCAHFLKHLGHDPVVHERADRLGGKLLTGSFAGAQVEQGADSFLPRDELPLDLCRAVGLGDDLIAPAVFGAYIWSNGALRRLPSPAPFGIPVRPWDARRAGLLSFGGALRASTEVLNLRPLRGTDVSLGRFLRKRLGHAVVDDLVEPLLGGTRAGTADEISLTAGAKEIDAVARRERSLLRGLARAGSDVGAGSGSFVSIRGGLGRLTDALSASIQMVLRESPVKNIAKLDAEAVVLAIPAFRAATLLETISPSAANELASITYHSSAVVTLLYPPNSFRFPADGSGVLIPRRERRTISGLSWYSHKWPESRPADGSQIVRCFVSTGEEEPPGDDDLIDGAEADVRWIMDVPAEALEVQVRRWIQAQPLYPVGHTERVEGIEAALPANVFLAGAAYHGSGIPDCIHSAWRAAHEIDAFLGQ